MKTLGFHHVALQTRDVARLGAFYREVLGLPELTRYLRDDGSLRSIWVGVGAQASDGFLALEDLPSADPHGTAGYSMVALRIDAADRVGLEALLARHHIPIERQSEWTVYVRDPDGNLVGLSHHPSNRPTV